MLNETLVAILHSGNSLASSVPSRSDLCGRGNGPLLGDQILLSWIEQAVSALGLLATVEDSGAIKNHQALISLEFSPCGSHLISPCAHINSRSLVYTEITIRFATQNGLQAQHLICKLEFRIGCSES